MKSNIYHNAACGGCDIIEQIMEQGESRCKEYFW